MGFLLGVCGPSGSGKSTLAKMLAQEFGAGIVRLDNYFLPDPPYKKYDQNGMNWELAENTDWLAIEKIIKDIQSGHKSISDRSFNFKTNTYTESELPVKSMMIVDGFLLLYDDALVKMLDLTVYIDTLSHVGLERRMHRDGTTENQQWYAQVTFPEYARHREVFKQKADVVLDGEKPLANNLKTLSDAIKRRVLLVGDENNDQA